MAEPLAKSLNLLLKGVSRSFYLTLRVLPNPIRPQIGLAYLLARATDTIADTEIVPCAQRLEALRAFRDRILALSSRPLDWGELAAHQGLPAERRLLERHEEIVSLLRQLTPEDLTRVRQALATIISGQELDLLRFGEAKPGAVISLEHERDLSDYTFRVAGCVGEFWTRMCCAHVFPAGTLDEGVLLAEGVQFGQGLQLVNILRDLAGDLSRGRCYLPASRLREHGLAPTDLSRPDYESQFRPVFDHYLQQSRQNLAAGWRYTGRLPHSCIRIRLACAWPILIGLRTLDRLAVTAPLGARNKTKISRAELRSILLRSVVLYPWPSAWNRLARF